MPSAVSRNDKRVLIIEDDATIGGYLKRKFEASGIGADIQVNGDDGLATIRSQPYDLIVLDLRLPGTDGHAILASKPMTVNASTPVVVLTSVCDSVEMEKARSLGEVNCLSKLSNNADTVVREAIHLIGD